MALTLCNLLRRGCSRILSSDALCSFSKTDNRSRTHFNSITLQSSLIQQTRSMSRIKQRHTHPRHTWPVKRRERNDQEIIRDNEEFVKQVILDRYGPVTVPDGTGMPFNSPLKQIVHERGQWIRSSMRTGVIARKLGSYPMWDTNGKRWMTTLLQVVDNHVVRYITPDVVTRNYGNRFKEGYGLLIVGAVSCDPTLFTKEYCGLFQECGTLPKKKLNRFVITPNAYLPPGTPLYATHYQAGQHVDIYGTTVRRGFQGVMRRWGFKGLRATHGVTKSHRRGGNIGGGGEKGRVWPGTKMPGHMGGDWRYQRNVKILRINTKYNILYVRGDSIPGSIGGFVTLRDTFYRNRGQEDFVPVFPTHYPEEATTPLPEDMWDPSMHNYGAASIMFEEKRQ